MFPYLIIYVDFFLVFNIGFKKHYYDTPARSYNE